MWIEKQAKQLTQQHIHCTHKLHLAEWRVSLNAASAAGAVTKYR